MTKLTTIAIALLFGFAAFGKTKQFCGKRDGTAGNAYLMDSKGNEAITLSQAGQDDSLLSQADTLVGKNSGVKGESGTQNGKKYCVVAELNEKGEPIRIIKAWHKK